MHPNTVQAGFRLPTVARSTPRASQFWIILKGVPDLSAGFCCDILAVLCFSFNMLSTSFPQYMVHTNKYLRHPLRFIIAFRYVLRYDINGTDVWQADVPTKELLRKEVRAWLRNRASRERSRSSRPSRSAERPRAAPRQSASKQAAKPRALSGHYLFHHRVYSVFKKTQRLTTAYSATGPRYL